MFDEYLGYAIILQTIGIAYLVWKNRRLEKLTEIVGDGLWLFFQNLEDDGPCDDLECLDCYPPEENQIDYKTWDGAE